MTNYVISAENLGKHYHITSTMKKKGRMFRDVVSEVVAGGMDALRSSVGLPISTNREGWNRSFWALQDVNFKIQAGESVGVIGSNGAGKSTLLKILARITSPTTGKVHLRGRVGSLLEVGTGFHQELTGRENIYLNGAILGMRRKEIDRKFDEIVAFSEVEEFLDTPVKYFSTGMRMRLAFSVAAHLEPEILLIDEVLAVGDVSFQKKSLNKMGDVISDGRTVLFVSHNMAAVRSLCQKAIYLKQGTIVYSGAVNDVVQKYLDASGERAADPGKQRRPSSASAQIIAPTTLTEKGEPCTYFAHDQPVCVRFDVTTGAQINNVFLTMKIYNQDLETILVTYEFEQDEKCLEAHRARQQEYNLTIPKNLLPPGVYFLGLQVSQLRKRKNKNKPSILHEMAHVAPFTVFDNGSALLRNNMPWAGVIHAPIKWGKAHGKA